MARLEYALMPDPWRLVVEDDRGERRSYALVGQTLLGRDPTCGIVVDDTGASRRHAIVAVSAEGVAVLDLESRNGTTVNGEPIRRAILRPGDRIGIGRTTLTLESTRVVDAVSGIGSGLGAARAAAPGSTSAAAEAEDATAGVALRGERSLSFSPHRARPSHGFFTADLGQAGTLRRAVVALVLVATSLAVAYGAFRLSAGPRPSAAPGGAP
jgi:hypothetical protein